MPEVPTNITTLSKGVTDLARDAAYVAVGLLASGFNIAGGIEQFQHFEYTRAKEFAWLSRLGSYPADWAYRLGWFHYGPVQTTVTFPDEVKDARIEPILAIGTADHTDGLNVVLIPDHRIQFVAEHFGYGGPKSDILTIIPGRPYRLYFDMGAFYPPLYSRYFSGWPGIRAIEMAKSRLEVALDDRVVLKSQMKVYEPPPWSMELGRNDVSYTGYQRTFSGRVESFRRLPVNKVDTLDRDGVWRLHLAFPVDKHGVHYPILAYGPSGSGLLIYLECLENAEFRIAFDNWGYGGAESKPFRVADQPDHTVDILLGALAAGHPWPPSWRCLFPK